MQPVQIAMSGVTPGTYGNENQIPTFTVDARGRLVFAANVDVQSRFRFKVNNAERIETINLATEFFNFKSGYGINVTPASDGINIDLDHSLIPDTSDFVRLSAANQQLLGTLKVSLLDAQHSYFDSIVTKEILINGELTKFKTRGLHVDFTDWDVHESKVFQINGITKNEGVHNPEFELDPTSAWIRFTSKIEQSDSTLKFPNGHSLGIISFQDAGIENGYGAGIIAIKNFNNDGSSPTGICLVTSDGISSIWEKPIKFKFSGSGVFEAPIIKAGGADSLPQNPEEGWIVFDKTSKQFKGWNGTAWITLG